MDAVNLDYLRNLLLPAESPAGVAVNSAILVLFAIGVLDVAIALVRLSWEQSLAERTRRALSELPAETAVADEGKLLAALKIPAASLLGSRVSNLLQLRRAGLDHRQLLDRPTAERLGGFGAIARYVGAILTLLGLFGTVLGLSFALFKIHKVLDTVDNLGALDELTSALGQTLYGMRMAFATTLVGLGTALLLSLCNFVVDRLRSRVHCRIEELVTGDLLVILQRAAPDADEAARSFAQQITAAAGELGQLQEVIVAAAERYGEASAEMKTAGDVFRGGAEEFQRGVAGLAGGFQDFLERAPGELRESVAALLSDLDDRHKDSVLGQLKNSQEAYEASLESHRQQLEAVVAENRRALTDLLGTEKTTLDAFSDLIVDLRLQVGALFDRPDPSAAIEAGLESNRALLQELSQLAGRFQPAVLEYHQQFRSALEAALRELRTGVEGFLADLHREGREGFLEQVGGYRQAFDGALERHREELRGITSQHQSALAELVDAQRTALRAFSDLVVDVHSRVGPLWDPFPAGHGAPVQRPEEA
jgi:hypothetical protein